MDDELVACTQRLSIDHRSGYFPAATADAWLQGIADAARPIFDRSLAMTRVAFHLAAAARLRWRMPASFRPDGADAIFTVTGKMEHLFADADANAPRVLPKAVARRLAADSVRASPERSLELWRALFAGRWSVLDHVDSDGKRFILAKRNEPDVDEPAALTNTERLVLRYASWGHSNKLIAYELGFAPSTVSVSIGNALRKLRLRSRADLVRLFFSRGAP